ncbi:MAG: 30S ribosomal protein S8 [Desulfobulbaceae bacterium]|uniref:Small ribosomal subunit protein uS8 n=1 Tax=Candidatus Desulfatifera sulfidica TaxID=2841691 RepID=A0A8J6TB50_9BACT|nr:30S ribosomal protein S8 [Candidatus Desulfatifera sulfidica]
MSMSDPLADMLTRIRNASMVKFASVQIPKSNIKVNLAKTLKQEGYISGFNVSDDGPQGQLTIDLKYGPDNESAITAINRVSKPGLRKYVGVGEVPRVLNGLGVAILSTSIGVITDREARAKNVGGEILCEVW